MRHTNKHFVEDWTTSAKKAELATRSRRGVVSNDDNHE